MARFIFVTGGVVSSLGKGLSSASLAYLLQSRGYKVRLRKLDPYLNVDPGTMSPFQHGEVYVTNDGAERRSMIMTDEEKKLTAYHEAGHAIVTINEKAAYPIHKATIIPRGRALGMVMQLPEKDEVSQTREQLHAQMAIAMGGRVAEEIIFGENKVTTGATSDIEQATKRARAMVMRAGLSKELGPVAYGENEEEVFLGRSVARQQNMSEETARKVDIEIRKFVDKGYEKARKILTEKIEDLHKLAKAY